MKGIYKMMLFLMIFQITALMIGTLGVFPYSIYSDIDLSHLPNENANWAEYIAYFFGNDVNDLASNLGIFTAIGGILAIAGIMALKNGTVAPFMVGVMASIAIHMLNTSKNFLSQLFAIGGPAVVYLGICLFVPMAAIVIFSIIEHPTGGDSG